MALFQIADLWTPDIWIQGMREKQATFPSVLNSGAVVRSPEFDSIATGGGVSVNVPFFKDITDQADEPQVENTAPTTQGITTGKQVAPILNRVTYNNGTALAIAVAGADPVTEILNQMGMRRLKQRNATVVAILRGAFNGLGANGAAAALSAVRVDAFDETGSDATSDQTMNADLFINSVALMGELFDPMANGAILAHSNVIASLQIADRLSFKELLPGESGLPFALSTYRGVPIFRSDLLVRAGTGNGFVYETYILAPGVIGIGEKAQAGDIIDVASLQFFPDRLLNNQWILDRTRFLLELNGMKWVGTPGGQSATNAELAVGTNWQMVYTTANRVGAICIRTNK